MHVLVFCFTECPSGLWWVIDRKLIAEIPRFVNAICSPAFEINHNYFVWVKRAQNNFDINNSLHQIYLQIQQMHSKPE